MLFVQSSSTLHSAVDKTSKTKVLQLPPAGLAVVKTSLNIQSRTRFTRVLTVLAAAWWIRVP